MPNARRAFTLIELIIVITIIAVVSAIAVPAYARFWERTQFEASSGQVADVLAYAHEQAVTHDMEVTVTASAATNTISVQPAPVTSIAADLPVALPGPDEMETPAAPRSLLIGEVARISGVTAPSGADVIRFHGDGTADAARITLVGDAGYGATLEILAGDGRVTVDVKRLEETE